MTPRRTSWLDRAGLLALLFALVGLTWRRWPDALVDVWRNLYVPWRLSEGALLYTDVADWYGPLPHLVTSAAFSLFGPGLDVLVVLNLAVAAACTVTLHATLSGPGDRLSAAVGTAFFVLVFAVGNHSPLGNYNYLTPYTEQATWGFLGVLWAVLGASRLVRTGWRATDTLALGVGLGVAFVTKAEALFAATAVLVVAVVLTRRVPWGALAGFAAVVTPLWALLTLQGGLAYGWWAITRAPAFSLDPQVRAALMGVPVFSLDLGTDAVGPHLLSHALLGVALALVGAGLALGAKLAGRPRRAWLALASTGVATLVVALDWVRLGPVLLLPTLAGSLLYGLRALRGDARAAPLAVLSIGAAAMLARMALNVRLYHYGFTMTVLACALVVHLLVFEAPRLFTPAPFPAARWLAVALLLGGALRLGEATLSSDGLKQLEVGAGRDRIITWDASHLRHGQLVREALEALEQHAPGAKTLVAFPDGAALSYLSRRPSPIAEFEFNPTALAFAGGPEAVLARLEAHPPDAVLVTSYELRAHGAPYFGATEASGAAIIEWLKRDYRPVAQGPKGPHSISGHTWDLLVRRREVSP